jgi:DNA polymerase I
MKILIIDTDYLMNKLGEPVIRLYGKKVNCSDEGKDIVLHCKGFEPYFYANEDWKALDEVKTTLGNFVKRVELVKKYKPIGYQTEKTEMLKIIVHNPKDIKKDDSNPNDPQKCRDLLEAIDIECMEADVKFKNRFLIDTGISGMSVIEFNHIGTELPNYGLNCNELYIINYKDIRLTDDKINIEY